MTRQLTIVVLGILGRTPFAGVAWQGLHYLEGFRRLGHDVWYVEDTGDWPFDLDRNAITDDPHYTLDYLGRVMAWAGFADRWAYRAACPAGEVHGPAAGTLSSLLARTDVLVNLTGATLLREEHLRIPVRVYLETDPVLAQLEVARGDRSTIEVLAAHTHLFTFGENLGTPECWVPLEPFQYHPTRQPVVLDWWTGSGPAAGAVASPLLLTTVASWRQTAKDIEWRGRVLRWSKHAEFLKILDLPRRARHRFELALARPDGDTVPVLSAHGWRVLDAVTLTKDILPYRDYVLGSGAEFTVAKEQYVSPRSGWFSDRSACYLAAGKPVVTQDTGFARVLPTGRGLFAFRTLEDAVGAVDAIASDYAFHARAAHEIAQQCFAAETVLARLLARAGC
jgi:hypothetical protein